ncbi:hypothetical protein DK389_14680 [Methylobacterium durans]|uniref:Uncharacterized protein n=1 Tax=Methylobacterium durans TaxID=2202825 RepID=A0A2U8W895_9HYPH|nr:hypothetical protein DK389_14680 [Methylobacterium durans]
MTGPDRVNFLKSGEADAACPSLAPACRERAYLVAGNPVVVSGTSGAFACATYLGAKGATRSGWLPRAALTESPAAAPDLDAWTGRWTSGPEQTIAIRRSGQSLTVEGDATYGAQDPDRVRRGAVNMGSFSVTIRPEGSALVFTDGEQGVIGAYDAEEFSCSVRMRLLPPILAVESNSACGGMNVSFSGLYRRGD